VKKYADWVPMLKSAAVNPVVMKVCVKAGVCGAFHKLSVGTMVWPLFAAYVVRKGTLPS
jgi:hypothetical protein